MAVLSLWGWCSTVALAQPGTNTNIGDVTTTGPDSDVSIHTGEGDIINFVNEGFSRQQARRIVRAINRARREAAEQNDAVLAAELETREAVLDLAAQLDERFNRLESRLDGLAQEERVSIIILINEGRVDEAETELAEVKKLAWVAFAAHYAFDVVDDVLRSGIDVAVGGAPILARFGGGAHRVFLRLEIGVGFFQKETVEWFGPDGTKLESGTLDTAAARLSIGGGTRFGVTDDFSLDAELDLEGGLVFNDTQALDTPDPGTFMRVLVRGRASLRLSPRDAIGVEVLTGPMLGPSFNQTYVGFAEPAQHAGHHWGWSFRGGLFYEQ